MDKNPASDKVDELLAILTSADATTADPAAMERLLVISLLRMDTMMLTCLAADTLMRLRAIKLGNSNTVTVKE